MPGAENLDIEKCLSRLDQRSQTVQSETKKYERKFTQTPKDYGNSAGYFCMLLLDTVLREDFGIHFSEKGIQEADFKNAKDLFIHGMIDDENGGTNVSRPVLTTAIARRCDYPVSLANTMTHFFCRWQLLEDRVNIDSTHNGMESHSDEYYTH